MTLKTARLKSLPPVFRSALWPRPFCWSKVLRSHHRHQSLDDAALEAWPRPHPPPATRLTTNAARLSFPQKTSLACWQSRAAKHRLRPCERVKTMSRSTSTTTINGDRRRIPLRPARNHSSMSCATSLIPDWRQRRLRHRRLRRVFGHRRWPPLSAPASCLAPKRKASEIGTVEGIADRRRPAPDPAEIPRSCRPAMRDLHAGHPGREPRRFWKSTRTQPRPRFAIGWPAIFAAAPAMTKSSVPSWTRPKTCGVLHNGF